VQLEYLLREWRAPCATIPTRRRCEVTEAATLPFGLPG